MQVKSLWCWRFCGCRASVQLLVIVPRAARIMHAAYSDYLIFGSCRDSESRHFHLSVSTLRAVSPARFDPNSPWSMSALRPQAAHLRTMINQL